MRHYTLLLLLCLSVSAFANDAFSGTISGTVNNAATETPLEYATVALYSSGDSSLVTGSITNAAGVFTLDKVPAGSFYIKVEFVGSKAWFSDNLILGGKIKTIDLGTIKLEENSELLSEVTVTGQQSNLMLSLDKKVFNVEQNSIATGGDAIAVLQQVPTLNVDMDGNITMRGSSNMTILINGKPSAITGENQQAILQQIPAANIERVELITNPSAKYDAAGTSGIINIILKKNIDGGLNGTAGLGLGTNDAANANVNLNYRKNKLNISSGINVRTNTNDANNISERKTIFSDTSFQYNQYGTARFENKVISGNIGVDYDFNDKQAIAFSANAWQYSGGREETLRNHFLDENEKLVSRFNRVNSGGWNGFGGSFNLAHYMKFDKEGMELNTSVNVSPGQNNNDPVNQTILLNADTEEPESTSSQTRNISNSSSNVITAQTDFTLPIKKVKFEAGLKAIIRDIDSEFGLDSMNLATQEYVTSPSFSNDFEYHDVVTSAYTTVSTEIGKFSIQGGLRLENTQIEGVQKQIDSTNSQNYTNLFPSVFVSRKLNEKQEIQINYSRRINRPHPHILNPFPNVNDPFNQRRGNPYLKPEYVNSFELNYNLNVEGHSLVASLYYRSEDQSITRIRNVDASGISTVSFQNLNSSKMTGLELTSRNQLFKWWSLTSNFNIYRSVLQGTSEAGELNTEQINWNIRLQSQIKLPADIDFQTTIFYQGPRNIPQGRFYGYNGVDIGLKKSILNNKGTLTLNVSDIFNERRFEVETSDVNYSAYNRWKNETRVASINFTYRFGKNFGPVKRRARRSSGDSGGSPGMDGGW